MLWFSCCLFVLTISIRVYPFIKSAILQKYFSYVGVYVYSTGVVTSHWEQYQEQINITNNIHWTHLFKRKLPFSLTFRFISTDFFSHAMQKRPSLLLAKWIGTSLYYQKLVFFLPVSDRSKREIHKSKKEKPKREEKKLQPEKKSETSSVMMRKINSWFRWQLGVWL